MPTNITTNKTFFSSFIAAFRAQSAAGVPISQPRSQNGNTSPGSTAAGREYSSLVDTCQKRNSSESLGSTNGATATADRPINISKSRTPSPRPIAAQVKGHSQFQATRQHAAPYHHRSTSPTSPTSPFPIQNHSNSHTQSHSRGTRGRDRRGSDSSTEGWRDVMRGRNGSQGSPEKWYIGGRTAAGEEKFYKLGVVRRERSTGELSADRLSI